MGKRSSIHSINLGDEHEVSTILGRSSARPRASPRVAPRRPALGRGASAWENGERSAWASREARETQALECLLTDRSRRGVHDIRFVVDAAENRPNVANLY